MGLKTCVRFKNNKVLYASMITLTNLQKLTAIRWGKKMAYQKASKNCYLERELLFVSFAKRLFKMQLAYAN